MDGATTIPLDRKACSMSFRPSLGYIIAYVSRTPFRFKGSDDYLRSKVIYIPCFDLFGLLCSRFTYSSKNMSLPPFRPSSIEISWLKEKEVA